MGWTERILILAAVAVAAISIAVLATYEPGPEGSIGHISVTVEGPDGAVYNDTVFVKRGTAYMALMEAAWLGNFTVEATGSGDTLFVTSIAGYDNDGAGGWCYAVWHDEWIYPQVGADVYGVHNGQRVLWKYHEDGCPTGGVPRPE